MYSASEKKIPFKKAIGYVILSVFIIWGSLFLTWVVHREIVKARSANPRYNIVAIVQSCPQKERLEAWQLAEILDLSRDKPQNLYAFDPKAARERLLACPVIKKAQVRRHPPSIVHIDYQVRKPYALLADFSNVAIDSDGYLFPIRPYFTPKKLPELALGLQDIAYNKPLESKEANLAFSIFKVIEESFPKSYRIQTIDTHNAYHKSLGLQEVVVVVENKTKTQYLRMSPRTYKEALKQFLLLEATFDKINPQSPEQIIDLRCPNIALVK